MGQAITKWLIGQGAKNIILASRSGLDNPDVQKSVHEMELFGAKIVVLKCDVSDRSSVEKMAQECSTLMPPIKGIIHGSAIFKASNPPLSPFHTIP